MQLLKMLKVSEKPGGTVPGAVYKSLEKEGNWLVKFPKHAIIAQNEVLAAKLYALAGINVPEMHLVYKDDILVGSASKFDEKLERCHLDNKLSGLMEGFAVDCWLANWDVVGLEYDNIMKNADGQAVRVDLGGAILFRAQGEPKGQAFGPQVTELITMLTPNINKQSAAIFRLMNEQDLLASLMFLEQVSADDISDAVYDVGLPSKVSDMLIKRHDFILDMLDKRPEIVTH